MRVRLRLAAIALAVLSTCAAATAAMAISRPSAAGPDPVTSTWTEWPHRASCEGGLPFDPVGAFSTPTGAEQGQLPSERALREVLASGELPGVGRHGWRHLAETAQTAEFAAGQLSRRPRPGSAPEVDWVSLEKRDGRWQLGAFSANCTPRSIRRGTVATPWALAPGQNLTAGTRRLRLEVEPQICNPIRRVRVQTREVREQNGHLVMTLWVRHVFRRATTLPLICPPQIKRIVVELPEKLGSRRLLDGGTYPPLPARRPL